MRFSPIQRRAYLILVLWGLWCSPGASVAQSFGSSPALDSLPATASAEAVVEDDAPQLRARLLVARDPMLRAGVLFDLAPGWHLYWRNPGETGIAPRLGLEATRHRVGEIAWPAPETFREADGLFTTFGYEKHVLLSAPLEALDERADEDVIRAEASVLVCRTQCVPATFSLSTPIAPELSAEDRASVDALFRRAAASVPLDAGSLGFEADAWWTAESPGPNETGRIELVVHACGSDDASCRPIEAAPERLPFIPMEGETFEIFAARIESGLEGAGAFTIGMQAKRLEAGEDRLRGLVEIRHPAGGTRLVELDLPIRARSADGSAAAVSMPSSPVAPERWARILLLALFGGLILNGMPCVLPVLAIKVVAIANMKDKSAREVRLHGLAYTAGVLASMALLAGIVIALRAAGHSVGWGFQFQEPIFVAAISALLVAFALNLFGVFEIEFGQGRLASVGQGATGLRRSVFEGLLAVVLATPCTAPFLGTAVGFAFASSGAGIVAIFLAIGFGLASPFLLVSFHPRFARFIPRSGPWMLKLRGGLGFSLLATVVWLLWILGQTGGTEAVIATVGNLLFLSFLLWGFGQLQPARSVWIARASAATIVALAVAGLNWIDFDRAEPDTTRRDALESTWRPYSEEAVEAALDSGRSAFVVFTADWCITCKVNEETVLDRDTIRAAFAEHGFALFKADWTRRDEGIRRKLAEFGRAGVPLYLVYSVEDPNRPRVLSELLSQDEVIAALRGPRFAQRH